MFLILHLLYALIPINSPRPVYGVALKPPLIYCLYIFLPGMSVILALRLFLMIFPCSFEESLFLEDSFIEVSQYVVIADDFN